MERRKTHHPSSLLTPDHLLCPNLSEHHHPERQCSKWINDNARHDNQSIRDNNIGNRNHLFQHNSTSSESCCSKSGPPVDKVQRYRMTKDVRNDMLSIYLSDCQTFVTDMYSVTIYYH